MRKIGIIYGGRSTEHDASIESKKNFIQNLDRQEFDITLLIFIDRDGNIYLNENRISLGELINGIKNTRDICYLNLLHGQEGEDGSWSGIFDICDGKGTFESVNTSSLLMNKYQQSVVATQTVTGLNMPKTILIKEKDLDTINSKLQTISSDFVIIKPNSMGASHFTEKIQKCKLEEIKKLVHMIFEYDSAVVIQEFVEGEEYTCGVINYYGNIISLPIIHAKSKSGLLDHNAKHKQGCVEVDFNDFSEKHRIQSISIELFNLFGVIGMCRFDFIITENNNIYYLEGNLIPGFSHDSAFPMMLSQANISLTDFTKSLFNAYDVLEKKNKFLPYIIE